MEKLNLETELQRALQSVDYKLMLKKCKKYKVKTSGKETFTELCIKYLNKKSKMKNDEFSAKEFLNPDDIIEDIVVEIIIAKHINKKNISSLMNSLINTLDLFINLSEIKDLMIYYNRKLISNTYFASHFCISTLFLIYTFVNYHL